MAYAKTRSKYYKAHQATLLMWHRHYYRKHKDKILAYKRARYHKKKKAKPTLHS